MDKSLKCLLAALHHILLYFCITCLMFKGPSCIMFFLKNTFEVICSTHCNNKRFSVIILKRLYILLGVNYEPFKKRKGQFPLSSFTCIIVLSQDLSSATKIVRTVIEKHCLQRAHAVLRHEKTGKYEHLTAKRSNIANYTNVVFWRKQDFYLGSSGIVFLQFLFIYTCMFTKTNTVKRKSGFFLYLPTIHSTIIYNVFIIENELKYLIHFQINISENVNVFIFIPRIFASCFFVKPMALSLQRSAQMRDFTQGCQHQVEVSVPLKCYILDI